MGQGNVSVQGCQNGYMGNDTKKCCLINYGTLFLVFFWQHTRSEHRPSKRYLLRSQGREALSLFFFD